MPQMSLKHTGFRSPSPQPDTLNHRTRDSNTWTQVKDEPAPLSDCSLKMTARSLTLLAATAVTAGYQWPNARMEAFDFLRWDRAGAHGGIVGTGVVPCHQFVGDPAGNQTNLGLDVVPLSDDKCTVDAAGPSSAATMDERKALCAPPI
jgi:hypothetical protein